LIDLKVGAISHGHQVFDNLYLIVHEEEKIMKKQIVTILTVLSLGVGATVYIAAPVQPDHYELHVVSYGETMESIIKDANHNSDVDYNIREAVTAAVSESKKLDNGAISRQLQVGDKVAVPIYR
jgi:hypothetical protein